MLVELNKEEIETLKTALKDSGLEFTNNIILIKSYLMCWIMCLSTISKLEYVKKLIYCSVIAQSVVLQTSNLDMTAT